MKSSEYWKKRFEDIEKHEHEIGTAAYLGIEENYREAQKNIESEIAKWYQRFADNNGVSLQEARRLLTSDELKELKWDIAEYIKYGKENAIDGRWVKQLENASAKFHINRLEALQLQTQQHLEKLFGNQLDSVDNMIKDVYTDSFYRSAFEIQKGLGVGSNFTMLDENRINKVINKPWAVDGKNFSDRIWTNKQKLVQELNKTLTQNIILGQDPQKAIDKIAKSMNVSKSVAGRLVMTEQAAFASAAQKDCFDELEVEQYEIVATLDSHTSEICQDMDGEVFKMSDWEVGVTAPPFHVYCRTTTVPYFDENFDEVSERAARDEEGKTYYVPENMKYEEWKESLEKETKVKFSMEESDDIRYNKKRTKEDLEKTANSIKADIHMYSKNPSRWSGTIEIDNSLIEKGMYGVKKESCSIAVIDTADDGIIWHEMLHSCSASYFPSQVYGDNLLIEEATVEFLKQQICAERGITNIHGYVDIVPILKKINNRFKYGTDMEFAKEIFNVSLPDRYEWLEDRVDESLRSENASFEDYYDVMEYVKHLKGGNYE